jgi:hypothetical protein
LIRIQHTLNIYRKKFAFPEGENLICCPVLLMYGLALADRAFKNKFTSLVQLYSLIVPSTTDRLRLKWDSEWAERPIFRDVEKAPCEDDERGEERATKGEVLVTDRSRKQVLGVKRRAGGRVRISKSRLLSYQSHRNNFIRLGRICGYRKRLQWYDWRRGSGRQLNSMNPMP